MYPSTFQRKKQQNPFMKLMFRWMLLLVFFTLGVFQAIFSYAQDDTLKIMSYNILNYPNADYEYDTRADTLAKIINYYTPDLFLIQELKNETGFNTLLDEVFNTNGTNDFASGTWETQNSNPGSSWKLQQNLIYNTRKLILAYEDFLYTSTRDINVFKFYFNDPNLDVHQKKTYLYVAVVHFKSSQGEENEAERLFNAQILMNFLDTLPENSSVIVGGDFNLYSSSEPAYQHLLDPENELVLKDPINTPGNWHNNYSYRFVHTQSTRTSPINGDGAGGGMDDRFDFILISENLQESTHPIQIIPNSYTAIGNNGNCFNDRIIDCFNNEVSAEILNALYQMSDHLPVKMELTITYPIIDRVRDELPKTYYVKVFQESEQSLIIHWPEKSFEFELYSLLGTRILSGRGVDRKVIRINEHLSGVYLIRINGDENIVKRILLQ
jgi:endonuclease/exonuclease/phosphatase family metal-dependent hydrolase